MKIIYVLTGTNTAKTAHFRDNTKDGVSIVEDLKRHRDDGPVEIVTDISVKAELWQDWLHNHFPNGVEDPRIHRRIHII